MYHNLSEKFQEIMAACAEPNMTLDQIEGMVSTLKDEVVDAVKLAYGLAWNDNADACKDNLEELLTNAEQDEGRKLANSPDDNEFGGVELDPISGLPEHLFRHDDDDPIEDLYADSDDPTEI